MGVATVLPFQNRGEAQVKPDPFINSLPTATTQFLAAVSQETFAIYKSSSIPDRLTLASTRCFGI